MHEIIKFLQANSAATMSEYFVGKSVNHPSQNSRELLATFRRRNKGTPSLLKMQHKPRLFSSKF